MRLPFVCQDSRQKVIGAFDCALFDGGRDAKETVFSVFLGIFATFEIGATDALTFFAIGLVAPD